MKSLRGAENIEIFNKKRTEERIPKVVAELRQCKKHTLQFSSLGLLASHIQDRTSIHRTTLLRNKAYLDLLAEHFSRQPVSVIAANEGTTPAEVLRLKLKVGQADAGILKHKICSLESKLDRISSAMSHPQSASPTEVALANVSLTLCLVLARLRETMIVDFSKRAIIDLAASPSEAVVAGPDRVGALIAWLDRHQGLPIVAAIRGAKR